MERRDFGAVRKLPSGRYQARWTERGAAQTAPETFPTKRAAQDYLATVRTRLRRGERVDPRGAAVLVGDLVAAYLENAQHRLKPKTTTAYESLARTLIGVRVSPARHTGIAARKIGDVRPSDVDAWLGKMSGLSASRRRQAHGVLSMACDVAVRDGRIPANPCKLARLPRLPAPDHWVVTAEDVERLYEAFDDRYAVIVDVLAWGGLRLGEALALRRRSVDLEAGVLIVSENLVEVRRPDGRWVIEVGTPKSHQTRRVRLPAKSLARLREHLAAHVDLEPDAYVFAARHRGGRITGPMRQGNFGRNLWTPATVAAGLKGLKRHDLRSTCASLLKDAGLTPSEAQAHLGHADVVTTMRIYTHLTEDSGANTQAALEKASRTSEESQAALKQATGLTLADLVALQERRPDMTVEDVLEAARQLHSGTLSGTTDVPLEATAG